MVMADLVESRDQHTGDHVRKTAAYADIILRQLKKEGVYLDQLSDDGDSDLLPGQCADREPDGRVNGGDLLLRIPFLPQDLKELAHPVSGSDHAKIIWLCVRQDIPYAQGIVPMAARQRAHIIRRSNLQLLQSFGKPGAQDLVRVRKTLIIGKVRAVVHHRDGKADHMRQLRRCLRHVSGAEKDQALLRQKPPHVFLSVHRPGHGRGPALRQGVQDLTYLFSFHGCFPPVFFAGSVGRPRIYLCRKAPLRCSGAFGASGRIRTADLLITNQLRCQLRYRSEQADYTPFPCFCQSPFSVIFCRQNRKAEGSAMPVRI